MAEVNVGKEWLKSQNARRSPSAATDKVRTGHQSEGGRADRIKHSAQCAGAGEQSD